MTHGIRRRTKTENKQVKTALFTAHIFFIEFLKFWACSHFGCKYIFILA